jgi:hypothetical protein
MLLKEFPRISSQCVMLNHMNEHHELTSIMSMYMSSGRIVVSLYPHSEILIGAFSPVVRLYLFQEILISAGALWCRSSASKNILSVAVAGVSTRKRRLLAILKEKNLIMYLYPVAKVNYRYCVKVMTVSVHVLIKSITINLPLCKIQKLCV